MGIGCIGVAEFHQQEVCIAGPDFPHAGQFRQFLDQPLPLGQNLPDIRFDGGLEGLHRQQLGALVDVVGVFDLAHQPDHVRVGIGQSEPQTCQSVSLREGLQHNQVGQFGQPRQQGTLGAEIGISFIHDHHPREASNHLDELLLRESIARRVVRAAEEEDLRTAVGGGGKGLDRQGKIFSEQHRMQADIVGGRCHGIHAVTGGDGYDVVAPGGAEHPEYQVDGFVAAVAQEDALDRYALDGGNLFLEDLLVRVGVAVPAGRVGAFVCIEEDAHRSGIFVARGGIGGQLGDVLPHEVHHPSYRRLFLRGTSRKGIRRGTALRFVRGNEGICSLAGGLSPGCGQAGGHRARMGVETFGFGHRRDGRGQSLQTLAGNLLQGHLAEETVQVHPAERPGPAAGGQGMVRTRGIVSGTLRRPGAHEDTARRTDAVGNGPGFTGIHNQMLGGIGIGKGDNVVKFVQNHGPAVLQGLGGEVGPRQQRPLALHLGHDGLGHPARGTHQHDLAVCPVLGLRQQVGRHEGGLGLLIGNDHHLGRTGRHIDGHGAARDPLFGGGHVAVAGPENLIYLGDGLRTVGHCPDSLGASQAENAPDAAIRGGVQHFRGDVAVRTGRRTQDHLRTTGDGGRDGQHQHGRKQRGGAARNIETHAFDRDRTLDATHAGSRFHHDFAGQLGFVEGADVAGGRGNGFANLG